MLALRSSIVVIAVCSVYPKVWIFATLDSGTSIRRSDHGYGIEAGPFTGFVMFPTQMATGMTFTAIDPRTETTFASSNAAIHLMGIHPPLVRYNLMT